MINLKKIGLTALAGSLVAFSANAVELSVSGGSEITYTTDGGSTDLTGNPFGAATSMKFSGSGDVGFGDATIVRTLRDNQSAASYSSAYTTIDMGDLGVLSFDTTGGGLVGSAANDDILPTAYEEVWHSVGSAANGTAGISAKNVLGYRHTIMGASISLGYRKGGADTDASGDGINTGAGSTGTTVDWNVKYDVPGVDGLTASVGYSQTDVNSYSVTAMTLPNQDDKSATGHILYSSGPVSVGYRMAQSQSGVIGTAGNNAEAYSVAFNVNDSLTVSYAEQDLEYDNVRSAITTTTAQADTTESTKAINAAYTMGAATIRTTLSTADDVGGVSGIDDEHLEVSLVLAF
jgi:outer membrane protein OmpU